MRIATWNISSGRLSKTTKQFDYYDSHEIDYFVSMLTQYNIDVVCLQEIEGSTKYSMGHDIAERAGMPHVFETYMSPSHITAGNNVGIAVISKFEIIQPQAVRIPYPTFDLVLPNGKPAAMHHKYLQSCTIDGIRIVNICHHPMEFLGHAYETELGQQYTEQLCQFYTDTIDQPDIMAGDFNTPDPTAIFSRALHHFGLRDVTPLEPTKPDYHGHLDAIFASSRIVSNAAAVVPTRNDHYLCWADIDV